MADKSLTVDGNWTTKTAPVAADRLSLINSEATPNTLQDITLEDLLKVINTLTTEATIASDDKIAMYDTSGGSVDGVAISTLSAYLAALAQTLTNKTLTTPAIASFANATHTHANAAGGGGLASLQSIGGRLTLATATPVMTTTQAAKTTIYWTPYRGQIVPIYDGTNMVPTDVGGELSQLTTDNTKSPAAVTTNSNYDLFIWNDAGTYRCTRGPAWTSDTGRGTGAGTTELEAVKGMALNKVAITNGPAAQRGTYVGTVRSNGSSQIDYTFAGAAEGGTAGTIGVWNMYNRVDVEMSVHDTTASWTFSSATAGPLNVGGTGSGVNNRISYVIGLAEDSIDLRMYCRSRTAAAANAFLLYGIGVDSTTVLSATGTVITLSALALEGAPTVFLPVQGQLGFHFAQMLQDGDGTNTSSMFGVANQNGLIVKGRF